MSILPIVNTDGQAHTVYQAIDNLSHAQEIVVINCDNAFDTNLDDFVEQCRDHEVMAGAIVFRSNGERKYGYVDMPDTGSPFFYRGVEKDPISPWALAGAFYFRNSAIFKDAFESGPSTQYISGLFERIPIAKMAYVIRRYELHEWGTPEDIIADHTVTEFST
jgi:NDP-sugar pyrophosphorylase family protein